MIQLDGLRVIQDVEARCWSTLAMTLRLLCLSAVIKLHEQLDRIAALPSAAGWSILRLLKPVMEPLIRVQKVLEGETYVTGSRAVPYVYDLKESLNKAFVDLREPAPAYSRGEKRGRPVCGDIWGRFQHQVGEW